jgi:hypothetical protein
LRIELRDERIVYQIAHRGEWRRAGREAERLLCVFAAGVG